MKLTVVGCSGSVSGPDSPASCYLLQAPYLGRTFSLVIDLGPGAFGALYHYLDPRQVDAIALSHLHPDHCLDVCGHYVAARYSPTAPWPRIPLYAPPGAGQRLAAAYEVPSPDPPSTGTPGTNPPSTGTGRAAETITESGPGIADFFDYQRWQPEQRIGPFQVRTARVEHPVEAYAMRFEEAETAATLVFSGDTGPCDALVDLSTGADLLLVEAAQMHRPTNPTGLHLSGRQAAEIGTAALVGALVLTHIPPWNDRQAVLEEAAPHFHAPVMLAESGAHWTIP